MNEQYKSKYLKYKNKYYNFIINKKLTGGGMTFGETLLISTIPAIIMQLFNYALSNNNSEEIIQQFNEKFNKELEKNKITISETNYNQIQQIVSEILAKNLTLSSPPPYYEPEILSESQEGQNSQPPISPASTLPIQSELPLPPPPPLENYNKELKMPIFGKIQTQLSPPTPGNPESQERQIESEPRNPTPPTPGNPESQERQIESEPRNPTPPYSEDDLPPYLEDDPPPYSGDEQSPITMQAQDILQKTTTQVDTEEIIEPFIQSAEEKGKIEEIIFRLCDSLGLTECDPNDDIKREAIEIFKIAKDKCKKANTNNICDLSSEEFNNFIDQTIKEVLEKKTKLEENDDKKQSERSKITAELLAQKEEAWIKQSERASESDDEIEELTAELERLNKGETIRGDDKIEEAQEMDGGKLYKYNDVLVNIMNDIYSSNEDILSNNAVKLIKKIVKKIKKKNIDDKYINKVNKIIIKISSVESVKKLEKYLKLLYKV